MQFSVVKLDTLRRTSDDFRIDAEFYEPRLLDEDQERIKYPNVYIGDECFVTDGQHGYHEVDEKSKISLLTAKNAKNWFASAKGADKLAFWVEEKNKRSSLKINDLILSTRGTVGFCALITPEVLPANIDQDVARIAVKKDSEIISEYLLTYLNCKFGQDWLLRNASGMVQQGLSLEKVRKIPVPRLSVDLQKKIQKCIRLAYTTLKASRNFYETAEHILLSGLGLSDWLPEHRLTFTGLYSGTKLTDRFDAEFFQPRYEKMVSKIKNFNGGSKTIGSLFRHNKTSLKIEPDHEYRYVEIGCVDISDGSIAPIPLLGNELPANAKIKMSKDDLIVSKVRPYRGAIGIVGEDELIGSGAFTVLREKGDFNKETLFVLLRSKPYLDFSLKFNSGTSYPTITDENVLDFPVPNFDSKIQDKVKKLVEKNLSEKNRSNFVLEAAKHAVEIAIEKNEKEATAIINAAVA